MLTRGYLGFHPIQVCLNVKAAGMDKLLGSNNRRGCAGLRSRGRLGLNQSTDIAGQSLPHPLRRFVVMNGRQDKRPDYEKKKD
jgi:hypothetical protein